MKRMLIVAALGVVGCADQSGDPWTLPEDHEGANSDSVAEPSSSIPGDWLDEPCVQQLFTGSPEIGEADAESLVAGLVHEMDHVAETLTAFYVDYQVDPVAACEVYPEAFASSGKLQLHVTCSPEELDMTWSARSTDESSFKLEVSSDHSEETWTGGLFRGVISDYHNGHGGWGDGFGNSATGELECLELVVSPGAPTVHIVAAGVLAQEGSQPVGSAPIAVRGSWAAGLRIGLAAQVADRAVRAD